MFVLLFVLFLLLDAAASVDSVIGCRSFVVIVAAVCAMAGGGSLFAIHNECEIYNPRANTWMPIASMLWRRSRSGVTSLRKMLYVVGG